MDEENVELTVEQLKNNIEALNALVANQNNDMQTLSLTLEVANERWIEAVNKITALEVELRKLKRGNNNGQ